MFKLFACAIALASAEQSHHHHNHASAVHKHSSRHGHEHVKASVDASGHVTLFEASIQDHYERNNYGQHSKKHGKAGLAHESSVIQTRVADISTNSTSVSAGHEEYHHNKHHTTSEERVHQHEWVIGCIICIFANFMSVTGFTTMKYSHRFEEPVTEASDPTPWYTRTLTKANMYWFIGIVIFLCAQPLNMLALVFSPISLVAPLCIFDVIFNMMFAAFWLQEPFTALDVGYTMAAACCAVGVIISGPHSGTPSGFTGKLLYQFWVTPARCIFVVGALIYLTIGLYTIIKMFTRRRRTLRSQREAHIAAASEEVFEVQYANLKWHEIFAFPAAASICSAFGQTFSKAIGTELRDGVPKGQEGSFALTCILGITFALGSLIIITRGIPFLDNRFFVPVHFSLTVVFLETIGIIFYSELVNMPWWQIIVFFSFCAGCLTFASLINSKPTKHATISAENSEVSPDTSRQASPTNMETAPTVIRWKEHAADIIPIHTDGNSSSTTSLDGTPRAAAASSRAPAAAPVREESRDAPQQPASSSSTAPAVPRYLRRPKFAPSGDGSK